MEDYEKLHQSQHLSVVGQLRPSSASLYSTMALTIEGSEAFCHQLVDFLSNVMYYIGL
jgi:hypothetical protein